MNSDYDILKAIRDERASKRPAPQPDSAGDSAPQGAPIPDWLHVVNTGMRAEPRTAMLPAGALTSGGHEETMMRTSMLPGKDSDYTKNATVTNMPRSAFKWAADQLNDEKRKQEIHDQNMAFNAEKQRIQLEAERQKLQLAEEAARKKLAPPEQLPDIDALRQIQSEQQQKYRANLSGQAPKQAADEGDAYYEDPAMTQAATSRSNPLLLAGLGGAAGAAAGHMTPGEDALKYREATKQIPEELLEAARKARSEGKIPANIKVKDIHGELLAPADDAVRYLKTMAHSRNAKRVLGGGAAGAGAGLLASMLLSDN